MAKDLKAGLPTWEEGGIMYPILRTASIMIPAICPEIWFYCLYVP
jgi:hypothetical protein